MIFDQNLASGNPDSACCTHREKLTWQTLLEVPNHLVSFFLLLMVFDKVLPDPVLRDEESCRRIVNKWQFLLSRALTLRCQVPQSKPGWNRAIGYLQVGWANPSWWMVFGNKINHHIYIKSNFSIKGISLPDMMVSESLFNVFDSKIWWLPPDDQLQFNPVETNDE